MNQSILVIMAAGLGSRFGGIKQLTPVGPNGEIIMDYSIYDAMQAGFKKVLFIIRKDIEDEFKKMIGDRISNYIKTDYVFQDIDDLPKGYKKPTDRTKPWGTGQAILACKNKIDAPFAVINADDYYGKEGFLKIHQFLETLPSSNKKYHYCMAGFVLGNTLSDFGSVTRGVCQIDSQDKLLDITETYEIQKDGDSIFCMKDGQKIYMEKNSYVSMNMWGFTPDIIKELETRFEIFLDNLDNNPLKAEYLLPQVVDKLLKENLAEVTVLKTNDKWFGVTYQEDKDFVMRSIKQLVKEGKYPELLFG